MSTKPVKKTLIREAVPMPEQEAAERRANFDEVALGYIEEAARAEADRCIACPARQCVHNCPVGVDVPAFIARVAEGDLQGAADILHDKNALPRVTGRVCPQEEQCQMKCSVGKAGDAVSVGRIERFVADWEAEQIRLGNVPPPVKAASVGQRVAVIGSGPSGLTCAADLIKLGYGVTVFEAFHRPGGVLVYGIPEFRLPKEIVYSEVAALERLGVEFKYDHLIGSGQTIADLFADGYEAIYIGTGAGLPQFMNIPGENLAGVYSANEYLTRVNLMKAFKFPEYATPIKRGRNVAVVGGGNVAMDAARTALRMGAEHVYLIYRRGRQEMPARAEEAVHAEEEGIEFVLQSNPVRYLGNDQGFVSGIECVKMEMGEPDASGRRRPVVVPASEFTLEIDQAILAVGTTPNPILARSTPGLETRGKGEIVADEEGATSLPGVFAGGDIVTGAATVITAMGAGRNAATAIDRYLRAKRGTAPVGVTEASAATVS